MQPSDYLTISLFVISAVGAVLMLMLSGILFFLKKWMGGVNATQDKILKSIDGIKEQVQSIQFDVKYQATFVREIEQRIDERQRVIESDVKQLNTDVGMMKVELHSIKLKFK